MKKIVLGVKRPTINRGGLGPQGSWKHPKQGPIDPSQPIAAPGADDAWAGSFSPVLKENQRFVPKDAAIIQEAKMPGLAPKHANTDPTKHLSQASTANGDNVAVVDHAMTDGENQRNDEKQNDVSKE